MLRCWRTSLASCKCCTDKARSGRAQGCRSLQQRGISPCTRGCATAGRSSCGINALRTWGWGYGQRTAGCSLPSLPVPARHPAYSANLGLRGGAVHPESGGSELAGGAKEGPTSKQGLAEGRGRARPRVLGLGAGGSAGGRALQALVELVLEAARGGVEGAGQVGGEPQDVGHHADVLPQPGDGDRAGSEAPQGASPPGVGRAAPGVCMARGPSRPPYIPPRSEQRDLARWGPPATPLGLG